MEQPAPPVKQTDEIFCPSCGAVIKREAEICVHCGVRVRRGGGAGAKSKTTAILLAVFLSGWTWLYTYREDSAKFWISMAIGLVNFVLTIVTLGLWWFVAIFIGIGIWIWAIVDTAGRSDDWYASY